MLEYHRVTRHSNTSTTQTDTARMGSRPRSSAQTQQSRYQRLSDLRKSLSAGSQSALESGTNADANAESEQQYIEDDQAVVEDEIHRYVAAGLIGSPGNIASVELLKFWQNHESVYPLMYRVALDILPVQASAVPCERIFSSSKETDALRRSKMRPELMEILQLVKYSVRQDRLTFTENWVAREDDLLKIDSMPSEVLEAGEVDRRLSAGDISGLLELITHDSES